MLNFIYDNFSLSSFLCTRDEEGEKIWSETQHGKTEELGGRCFYILFLFPIPFSDLIGNTLIWCPQGESVLLVMVIAGWSLPLSWSKSLFIFSLLHSWGGQWQNSFGGHLLPNQGQPTTYTKNFHCHASGTEKWYRKLGYGNDMAVQQGSCQVLFHLLPGSFRKQSLFLGRNADQVVRSSYDWAGHNVRLYLLFAQLSVSHGGSINMIKYSALFNSRVISMSTKPSPLLANLKASGEKWQMKFMRRNQSKIFMFLNVMVDRKALRGIYIL